MLKKILKTLIVFGLVTFLIYGEGNNGSENDTISNIIKNNSENSQTEKERKKQEREEKKQLKKEEKERKKREKKGIYLPTDNTENLQNDNNHGNNENTISPNSNSGKANINSINNQNNPKQGSTGTDINTNISNTNDSGNKNTREDRNRENRLDEDISRILEENRKKEEAERRSKIDKRKPVVQAIDKEKEGASQYKDVLMKFIATKDGKVIKKELETQRHPIASLTKVMNILVALDQIDKGNAGLDDKVCFTPQTVNLGGSWLNARVGDCYILRDLLRSEIIYSANNSAYLVAYHIGKGDISYFVKLMNDKAKELGMNNTEFYTPTGLPTSMTGQGMDVSTAYDMYLMGKKAIEDKRIREWASEQELVLINPLGEQVIYPSRNHLLGKHGIFGLKTGYHVQAGYNIIVASKMGNVEVISVVMGHLTNNNRTKDQNEEFAQIEKTLKRVYELGEEMGDFIVKNSPKRKIKGILSDNVYQIENSDYEFKTISLNSNAKINKGDVIGKLQVISRGNIISEIDIIAIEEARELTWFGKFLRFISFGLL